MKLKKVLKLMPKNETLRVYTDCYHWDYITVEEALKNKALRKRKAFSIVSGQANLEKKNTVICIYLKGENEE